MKKLTIAFLAILALVMSLAGCGKDNSSDRTMGDTEKTTDSGDRRIAYITGTGGLGDKSFNDLGYQGIKALMDKGVACDVAEPKSISEVEGLIRNFADMGEYALIITMGGDSVEPIAKVAADYPETNFMVIDGIAGMDNVKSVSVLQVETGFLIGAYAGLMEKEGNLPGGQGKNVVGVVGGNDIPLIRGIIAGFECGVRYVNPDCKVLSTYVGSWNDPGKGSELTQDLYEQGADIVFQAAGASGMGVFEAAQKRGLYAIGYDGNQNVIAPDNVIGSGVRGLGAIIEETGDSALAGDFVGGDSVIAMSDNPLSSQIILDDTNVPVPDEIKSKMEKIKDFLVNTGVEIPSEPDQVDAYLEKVGVFVE